MTRPGADVLPGGSRAGGRPPGWSVFRQWLWASWQRARQRRDLLDLDDRLLRDIGIDRIDARREAEKPFWQ